MKTQLTLNNDLILYMSGSEKSAEAKKLLDSKDLEYSLVFSYTIADEPSLFSPFHFAAYKGLPAIMSYVNSLPPMKDEDVG